MVQGLSARKNLTSVGDAGYRRGVETDRGDSGTGGLAGLPSCPARPSRPDFPADLLDALHQPKQVASENVRHVLLRVALREQRLGNLRQLRDAFHPDRNGRAMEIGSEAERGRPAPV